MALTTTIEEVKAMLPNFISNLSDTDSLPNFLAAEYKYLVPVTGVGLYNDIHTKYNTTPGAMTPDETNLLLKMRLMVVAHAYHDGLILGHITLTDNGARKFNPNDTVPVAKWEYEKLERTLLNTAYDAMEVLLLFLFEKKASFALWTASAEYISFNSLLIKTGTDFSEHFALYQPMRTFFSVRKIVRNAQDMFLVQGVGVDLLAYIIGKVDPDTELTKIILKLKSALAFYTIKLCCEHYNVRFSHEGFTVLSGETNDSADHGGRKSAEPTDLDMKMQAAQKMADHYMAQAQYSLVAYYNRDESPVAEDAFKTAFDAGPLKSYVDPADRTSGNETHKGVFRL